MCVPHYPTLSLPQAQSVKDRFRVDVSKVPRRPQTQSRAPEAPTRRTVQSPVMSKSTVVRVVDRSVIDSSYVRSTLPEGGWGDTAAASEYTLLTSLYLQLLLYAIGANSP